MALQPCTPGALRGGGRGECIRHPGRDVDARRRRYDARVRRSAWLPLGDPSLGPCLTEPQVRRPAHVELALGRSPVQDGMRVFLRVLRGEAVEELLHRAQARRVRRRTLAEHGRVCHGIRKCLGQALLGGGGERPAEIRQKLVERLVDRPACVGPRPAELLLMARGGPLPRPRPEQFQRRARQRGAADREEAPAKGIPDVRQGQTGDEAHPDAGNRHCHTRPMQEPSPGSCDAHSTVRHAFHVCANVFRHQLEVGLQESGEVVAYPRHGIGELVAPEHLGGEPLGSDLPARCHRLVDELLSTGQRGGAQRADPGGDQLVGVVQRRPPGRCGEAASAQGLKVRELGKDAFDGAPVGTFTGAAECFWGT